jgi:large subunit ribosomal protein L7/L12
MENLTQENVVQALGNLTVLELIALTKQLENQWGVKAEPQVSLVTNTAPVEETVVQTEFSLVFLSFPADKKMALVKLVREVLGLGLLESKNLVESLPKTVKDGLTKDEVEALKARFVEAGATVEVQ